MKVQEVKINRYERVGTPVALSGSFRPHSLRASKNKLTKLSRWSKQWGVLHSLSYSGDHILPCCIELSCDPDPEFL